MIKRNYYLVHFTCKLRDRESFTGSIEVNTLVHEPKNIVVDLEAFIADRVRDQRPELKFDKLQLTSVFLLHTETVEDAQDEIRRLREENERQRFDILAMNQLLDLMREENERLRKDAERHQHIRSLVRTQAGAIKAQAYIWHCGNSRRKLNAAIDAVRGAK